MKCWNLQMLDLHYLDKANCLEISEMYAFDAWENDLAHFVGIIEWSWIWPTNKPGL